MQPLHFKPSHKLVLHKTKKRLLHLFSSVQPYIRIASYYFKMLPWNIEKCESKRLWNETALNAINQL